MALRPGSARAVELWQGGTASAYAAALSHYDRCVAAVEGGGAKTTKGLVALDQWVRSELPQSIAATHGLVKEDLVKVCWPWPAATQVPLSCGHKPDDQQLLAKGQMLHIQVILHTVRPQSKVDQTRKQRCRQRPAASQMHAATSQPINIKHRAALY
jgi:hypothetical protein